MINIGAQKRDMAKKMALRGCNTLIRGIKTIYLNSLTGTKATLMELGQFVISKVKKHESRKIKSEITAI